MKNYSFDELCELVKTVEKLALAGNKFCIDYGILNMKEVASKLNDRCTEQKSSSKPSDTNKNFLTPHQCALQFEMYAKSHPSPDSQHSLRFCANFLREFCKNVYD